MKEKEKDFNTLASDILIELYNDIKEHEIDLTDGENEEEDGEKPSAGLSKKKKKQVAKKARKGGDIGKPGKGFEKVERAAKKSGKSPEAAEKIAAAAMWKNVKR